MLAGHGIEGDAHAGDWHRQISLLAQERILQMISQGVQLKPGDFGENIICQGFDLDKVPIGARISIGPSVVLQVSQHGKECHTPCAIYQQIGDCIMPKHGTFARVRRGGTAKAGMEMTLDPALNTLRYAILILSDRSAKGQREDISGQVIDGLLDKHLNGQVVEKLILPDQRKQIEEQLIRLCDQEICDLIITSGGTGLSPRDVTPEATLAVIDREIPGMAEAMRQAGSVYTSHAMLSRAVCGQRGPTLIINLSGSPRAVEQQLEAILPALPHAVQVASGIPQDCGK